MSLGTCIWAQTGKPGKEDTVLLKKDYSPLKDSIRKKVPVYFSMSSLLASLPYDSVTINRGRLFFRPAYNYNFKNSFLSNEKWQDITRLAGYTLLSFIGDKNNFIYTFPQ